MKRLLPFLLLCIAVFFARPAEAVRAYADGGLQSNGTLCPVTGNAVTVLQSYAGYFTDPNEPYPRAGDLAYVRAVGINVSPCVNDAVGFEFFPPLGANLAISATNPVYCIVGKLDGSITPYNVPNNANGSCSQTPSIGRYGGYYFGFSALPPGWYLQIQVPVVFTQQLFGLAGPTSHRLTVAALSTYGDVFPYQPVTVYAAVAQSQTLTVSKTGTGTGTVTSSPASINCGATCSASFTSGSSVTLTASPAAGSNFSGWSGGVCTGTGTCTVTMSSAQSVNAQFTRQIGSLSVTLGGLPAGSVVTLSITGPNGFSITNNVMTGTGFNLSAVSTGTYTVTAPSKMIAGVYYQPNARTQSAVVNAGTTATISVTYRVGVLPLIPIINFLLD